MGIHHVQVALVDGDVGRLANRSARVVQPGAGVGELDEILEIFQRAIPSAPVQVHHKGRTIGGRKHHTLAANLHRVGRVAGVLGKFPGRGFEYFAQMAGLKTHPYAIDLGTSFAEQRQAGIVIANVNANFGHQAFGRSFNLQQVFLTHDVVGGNVAGDVGWPRNFCVRIAPLAAAAPVFFGISFTHVNPVVCLRPMGMWSK